MRFERFCGFVAWSLPLGSALARSSSLAQWRGDVGVVRDVALAGMGWGGGVSTALSQGTLLLPLGSQTFRATLVSVLALGLFASLLFRFASLALRSVEAGSGLTASRFAVPAFATIATLLACMSPTLQLEATASGSSLMGAALALGVITRVANRTPNRPVLQLAETAILLGLTFAENAVVALAALATCAAWLWPNRRGTAPRRPRIGAENLPDRVQPLAVSLFAVAAAIASFSGIVRSFAPNTTVDLGGPFLWGSALPAGASLVRPVLTSFSSEIGWVAGVGAVLGCAHAVRNGHGIGFVRVAAIACVIDVALLGVIGPTEGTLAVRALSFATLCALAATGVFSTLALLVKNRVPFARAGAALVVAIHFTVIALLTEQAGFIADRSAHDGADCFTEIALDQLPQNAAVIVDDPRVTWRLFAAQAVEGRRRDVLVIPKRLLHRGRIATSLLTSEPRIEPFLRTVALEGSADEWSLSELADGRPLFLVPEVGWDAGIYDHLTPRGAWLEFDSEPKTTHERSFDVDATVTQMGRVSEIARRPGGDPETKEVIQAVATVQAKLLLRVGQVDSALDYLARMNLPNNNARALTRSLDVMFASTISRLPSTTELRAKPRAKKKVQAKKDAPPLFRKPRKAAERPAAEAQQH